tara:strand:- start:1112 stop:1306 length:195 start_codon:yes stop_codon:yes gene_type:complete
MLLAVAIMVAFFVDNSEFMKTVEQQRAEGYTWSQIDCRQVEQGLPALTIDTPTGKQLVCHKLQK